MTNTTSNKSKLYLEALDFHAKDKKGKIGIETTKPLRGRYDLSLAYSPGVSAPCLEIKQDPSKAFEYTSKGNFVAVVSNGTAVLGLGNLGALASKPVMEGKAALFKRFSDIDSIDIEVETQDPEEFVNCVKNLAPSWGGINLEDIKAPECFIIEEKLKSLVDIPVFHDDQHGTAIIVSAGLLNACHIAKKELKDVKIVVNGAGAAAIACINLLLSVGASEENITLCDTKGVVYKGRKENMNQWKEKYATNTSKRTLEEAMKCVDIFLGLSVKGAVSKEMVASMASAPIVFALANPDPEITPEDVKSIRSDAIIATGRSDYNNQVNNVLCFPYIFRGALDVQATCINQEMKIAAVHAIANLARSSSPSGIDYSDKECEFSADYIIPTPFDPRLMQEVPVAVAKAAVKTGVARSPIEDMNEYKLALSARQNPESKVMENFFSKLRNDPKTVIFSSGEDIKMIEAAVRWCNHGYGKAILIGRRSKIKLSLESFGVEDPSKISAIDPQEFQESQQYTDHLYGKMQRSGMSKEDCKNLLFSNCSVFAAEMLLHKKADAMVAGLGKNYLSTIDEISSVIGKKEGASLLGMSALIKKDNLLFLTDTAIHENPSSEELAKIAISAAQEVKILGYESRVAFVSFSNFGNPGFGDSKRVQEAVKILDSMKLDFEYDGEMAADVALNPSLLKKYPFNKLSGPANILVMPSLHSAHIATKLLQEFGEIKSIGPILCGLSEHAQVVQIKAEVSEILNAAAIAAAK